MSIDYQYDYANHSLVDNKIKYEKIYKLTEVIASDVTKGDLVLLKCPCGQYRLYMATADSSEDNTLHLTPYSETDVVPYNSTPTDGLIISQSGGYCGC